LNIHFFEILGSLLGPFWPRLGPLGPILAPRGVILEPRGPFWRPLLMFFHGFLISDFGIDFLYFFYSFCFFFYCLQRILSQSERIKTQCYWNLKSVNKGLALIFNRIQSVHEITKVYCQADLFLQANKQTNKQANISTVVCFCFFDLSFHCLIV